MNTVETLVNDLHKLGIKENDNVFIRISYKAIGKTEGGPQAVVDALLKVIGPGGTLIATAFPNRILSYKKNRKEYRESVYHKGAKPTTGVIPVIMSQNTNAFFSSHPISPYVAIGAIAEELTSFHTPETDSYEVVKLMTEKYHCKCLRIGGHVLDGTTHVAFTDGLKNTKSYQVRLAEGNYYLDSNNHRQWMEKSVSAFCYNGFSRFFYDKIYSYPGAVLSEGMIGEGKAMLTDMQTTLLVEREFISKDPTILSCDSPTCNICRTSFSYSDQSYLSYSLHQIKYMFNRDTYKDAIVRIRTALLESFHGSKCQ